MGNRLQMVKILINGFKDFRERFTKKEKLFFQKLAKKAQKPHTMVISCSDSRVDPAILFETKPGELFVVRNVANLVPPYQPNESFSEVSAAIEFGVRHLKVKNVIVLGHAFCGGINAFCSNLIGDATDESEFIGPWLKILDPASSSLDLSLSKDELLHNMEKVAIVNSIKNLRTFPWIRDLEKEKKIEIHGWWFDLESGYLWSWVNNENKFKKLAP